MPRGGPRQGTPGTGYSNRTDLTSNYDNTQSAAGGAASPQPPASPAVPLVHIGADDVPSLYDPTTRPNEPVMAGVPMGPGPGPEAMGPMPPAPVDPVRQALQAMMLIAPNADLTRAMNRLDYEGR
jgi:hypothetical protein